ncbi:MAG: thiol-disulfide oxidoreductase DCC family protein [Candidatus Hydrogenedentota bacterium]
MPNESNPSQTHPVVLFDGECMLCDAVVRFILKHEKDHQIKFAPLQSEIAQHLLPQSETEVPDSVVYIANGQPLFRSDAAIAIVKHLRAPWSWTRFATIIPRPLRDLAYRLIATTRYTVFGRKESCTIPTALELDRQLTKE